MRITCIYIHHMPVQLARVSDPALCGPLVVGGLPFGPGTVQDASPEALACGVKPGMALRQAHSLCPDARFLPSNEAACEEVFVRVLDLLHNFGPTVDVEQTGCAYIDITGVREEGVLVRKALSQIQSLTSLTACAGVSGSKFFARAAAFTTKPELPAVLAPGAEKGFIAPCSVELLPCLPEIRERLRLIGVKFIGQLARFPREALIAQFGAEGDRLHGLATGYDPTPLVPRTKPETVGDTMELYPPAKSAMAATGACGAILGRLLPSVRSQGKVCSEVTVRLKFESHPGEVKRLPFKEPAVSSLAILKRIQVWLETMKFPTPLTEISIFLRLTHDKGKKLSLWQNFKEDPDLGKVAQALRERFGYQPLKRVQLVDRDAILPERRSRVVEIGE